MHVIGIVVEYNPFHNGHLYQINKVKEMYPDSIIIVAMSGYFTERGEISILSKWDKASLALEYGVDIVLEIPFVFCNQSADIFSYAAISILNAFKVDTLVFGSESNNIDLLYSAANVQLNNKEFDSLVKKCIDKGNNYPTSLSKAIKDLTNNLVVESNDILGVSYIKEILKNQYNIQVNVIKRTSKYLDMDSNENIVSAGNIRNKISKNSDISKYVPNEVLKYIRNVDYDYFYDLLKYKILSSKSMLCNIHLIDEGLENRIYNGVKSSNLNELINNIKCKRYTYNRINRILINIFVGLTKEDAKKYKNIEYIRVLGFSKIGRSYYKEIKKDINIPVITKFQKFDMLELELRVSSMYSLIVHDDKIIEDEIKRHSIIK